MLERKQMLETKALSLRLQPFYSRAGGLEGDSYVSTYGDPMI